MYLQHRHMHCSVKLAFTHILASTWIVSFESRGCTTPRLLTLWIMWSPKDKCKILWEALKRMVDWGLKA